jgi:hypothetical protein
MDVLLVLAIALIVVAVLGFTGVIEALRAGAWWILAVGLLVLAFSFLI